MHNNSNILLAIDLSTTSTGIAVFDMKTKKLTHYQDIKPKVPGIHKMNYPEAPLMRILSITSELKKVIEKYKPSIIVLEEVNNATSRISQKSLSAIHFFVLDQIRLLGLLRSTIYMDSNGATGWRKRLDLKLSEEDKAHNKLIRSKNMKNKLKQDVIDWKDLSVRFVNTHYSLKLTKEDNDIADAICLGHAFLLISKK